MKKYLFALGLFGVSILSLSFTYTAQATVCMPESLAQTRLLYGARGSHILNLQLCLLQEGYAIPAGATGYYGVQTRTAVKAFYASALNLSDWDGGSVGPMGRTALAAKAALGGATSVPVSTKTSFKKVTSAAEFQKYVQAATDQNSYGGVVGILSRGVMNTSTVGVVPPTVAPTPTASQGTGSSEGSGSAVSTPSRVSDTNVQIPGVDEPDIVKTDGTSIYISQQSWRGGGIIPMSAQGGRQIAISPLPPDYFPQGQTLAVSAFPLSSLGIASKDITEQGEMLLVKDKKILVIFSQPNVVAYDIADPKKPVKKWTFSLGDSTSIVTSRLKDGKVYLVTNTWLNQASPCPVVPMTKNGISFPIACTDVWVPNQIEPTNTLYTISSIDPVTGTATNKLTVAGDSNNTVVSVSENNIYLTYRSQTAMTSVLLDFYATKLTDFLPATTIARIQTINSYDISSASKINEVQIAINAATVGMNADVRLKFDNEVQNRLSSYLDTRARDLDRSVIARIPLSILTIAATGNIPGHLLNQFSLDEYNNNVRVAVTVGDQWGMGGGKTKNDVYVFDANLATLGSVTDLGFEGERVYAARFVGPRGYLVTFRQTDPFYVLDLSNPSAPKMAGQLKIPGYSSYLEPVDTNTVVGVGQDGSQVKLSLFDVSDPQNPVEKSKYTLAENWTEVENNHHAFLRDPLHSVFFIPGGNGGYVFSYTNGTLALKATHSGYSVKRAVYIDNYLYIIGDDKLAVFDEITWKKVTELALQ